MFRILVDKPRSDPTLTSNEPILMENKKDSTKKGKSIEEIASDEYERVQARFVGGRSIDRGNPEDEDELIQSDDEGMIEEIVTTVEQDKDLECKVKKKIETKKTIAQHPQTHNTITKVVKTEVTEITRTITINDHHDLERAKRELGIDDVNRLLPSSTWIDYPKRYETSHDVSTSKGTITKQQVHHPDEKPLLAQSTVVGRGPVVETISPVEVKSSIESKKKPKTKKKKSKFCSCTRAANDDDDEKDKQPSIAIPVEQATKKSSVAVISTAPIKSVVETQIQGQALISSDLKDLIIEKKLLLIEYIHSKIFTPTNLFTSIEEDMKGRKISSRILDLLRYDRCSSWKQMSEQLTEEYAGNSIANRVLQPMINTYENLFTTKQANLFNTFATIHHENDIRDIQQNHAYLNIAQTHIHHQSSPIVETIPETVQVEQGKLRSGIDHFSFPRDNYQI